jgi:hypothetical protein
MAPAPENAEVWELLSCGGAVVSREETQEGTRVSITKYDPLSDPGGAMRMATLLAAATAKLAPTLIVTWEHIEDVVLGFAVGADLSVPVVRLFDVEGLVRYRGTLPREARCVFLTDAVRGHESIEALRAVLDRSGGLLSGVVSIVALGDEDPGIPVISLVSATDGPGGSEHGG